MPGGHGAAPVLAAAARNGCSGPGAFSPAVSHFRSAYGPGDPSPAVSHSRSPGVLPPVVSYGCMHGSAAVAAYSKNIPSDSSGPGALSPADSHCSATRSPGVHSPAVTYCCNPGALPPAFSYSCGGSGTAAAVYSKNTL